MKEWQKMGGDKEKEESEGIQSRNKFVRRILEISAMVAKQNDQIRKVRDFIEFQISNIYLDSQFRAIHSKRD